MSLPLIYPGGPAGFLSRGLLPWRGAESSPLRDGMSVWIQKHVIKVCDSQAHSTPQKRYTGTSLPWALHMAPASQSAIECMREHVALNPAHSSGKHGPEQPDRSLHVQWALLEC